MASVSFQLPACEEAFIGNNKAAKSSSMQFFDLFHGLLYLAVTPYRNRFLGAKIPLVDHFGLRVDFRTLIPPAMFSGGPDWECLIGAYVGM
jgi:hypothetical protein